MPPYKIESYGRYCDVSCKLERMDLMIELPLANIHVIRTSATDVTSITNGSGSGSPISTLRIGALLCFWPQDALLAARDLADAFINKFLKALAFVRLGRIKVALRICGDAVHAEELTGLPASVTKV